MTAKGLGRKPYLAVENAGEITAIRKTDLHCNLRNAALGSFEQSFGLLNTITLQILDRCCTEFLTETKGEIIFSNTDMAGNVGASLLKGEQRFF